MEASSPRDDPFRLSKLRIEAGARGPSSAHGGRHNGLHGGQDVDAPGPGAANDGCVPATIEDAPLHTGRLTTAMQIDAPFCKKLLAQREPFLLFVRRQFEGLETPTLSLQIRSCAVRGELRSSIFFIPPALPPLARRRPAEYHGRHLKS